MSGVRSVQPRITWRRERGFPALRRQTANVSSGRSATHCVVLLHHVCEAFLERGHLLLHVVHNNGDDRRKVEDSNHGDGASYEPGVEALKFGLQMRR